MSEENNQQQGQDFGSILAEFEQAQPAAEVAVQPPRVGEKVRGRVTSIGPEAVFVDLGGGKAEGQLEIAQVSDAEGNLKVAVGDEIDATVSSIDAESGALHLRRKAQRGGDARAEIERAYQQGLPVEGIVTAVIKGGVEVQVHGMRAFCPMSQLDLRYVENPERFLEQRLPFKVARYEEGKGRRPNIVLSRRSILEEEQKAKAAETRERLAPGAILQGRVTSLTDYGAFIDLGGIEGMLHVSEIGHSRVGNPKDVLQVGQELEVQVIKIEPARGGKPGERISLSRKALERDPWEDAATRYPAGTRVRGKVMRLETFGAFIELEPGLEGLVHISELGAGRRLRHPREAVDTGQEIEVTVLAVDPGKRRISLSMRDGSEREADAGELGGPGGPGGPGGGGGAGGGGGREMRGDFRELREGGGPPGERERGRGERGERTRGRGERERDRERERQRGEDWDPEGGGSGFGSMADFFRTSRTPRKR